MFKRGDKVIHNDYGTGEVWRVNPNEIVKRKDKNNKPLIVNGTIDVAFDSEMGEDDGNGGQKVLTFLLDGRENPIGSGYFWGGVFYEFDSSIALSKS